jgi:multiple sugar transport system substrate-binding protein
VTRVRRLLLAVLLALATGCGGTAGGAGAVRFLAFGDPAELAAYRTVIRAYRDRSGGADVRLVEASDRTDLIARLSTSIAGGRPPDVFLINYRFYGQFAAKGAIEPIEPRAAASTALDLTGFYPQALDAFRWRGRLHCLPQNVSSLVVYYNRDLFRRHRVPEPRADWSWQEFVATASALTRDAAGRRAAGRESETASAVATYGLGVEPTLIRLAPFVWSNGADLVDDVDSPTRLTLDTPAAIEVLREFLALRTPYGVVPTDVEVEAEEDEARFANGRLAMLLSSRRSTPTFRGITGFDWDVAPLPRFREPVGILHSDAYCLARASPRQDAAWRFVEFALGPEGQRIVAATGRTVPSLRAVAQSPAFLDPAARPRSSRVFLDGIAAIRRVPSISTWPEIEDATEGVLENALYRRSPVGAVVRELDEATRPLFARADRS